VKHVFVRCVGHKTDDATPLKSKPHLFMFNPALGMVYIRFYLTQKSSKLDENRPKSTKIDEKCVKHVFVRCVGHKTDDATLLKSKPHLFMFNPALGMVYIRFYLTQKSSKLDENRPKSTFFVDFSTYFRNA